MENQHKEIKGYRDLSRDEIDLMNKIKNHGIELGVLIDELRNMGQLDQRWISIGQTNLQTCLMALTRAIAQPTIF